MIAALLLRSHVAFQAPGAPMMFNVLTLLKPAAVPLFNMLNVPPLIVSAFTFALLVTSLPRPALVRLIVVGFSAISVGIMSTDEVWFTVTTASLCMNTG